MVDERCCTCQREKQHDPLLQGSNQLTINCWLYAHSPQTRCFFQVCPELLVIKSCTFHFLPNLLIIKSGTFHFLPDLLVIESGTFHFLPDLLAIESGTFHFLPDLLVIKSGTFYFLPDLLAIESGIFHFLPDLLVIKSCAFHFLPDLLVVAAFLSPVWVTQVYGPTGDTSSKPQKALFLADRYRRCCRIYMPSPIIAAADSCF